MKKFFLLMLAICAVTVAKAASDADYFQHTFTAGETLPEGWSMWSDGLTPKSPFNQDFSKGDAYKTIEFSNGDVFMMSCSTNTEGKKANVGLVTPKISVPETPSMFTFRAANYNPGVSRVNSLSVYISTAGNSQDDFNDDTFVDQYRVTANTTTFPTLYFIPMEKYAGKEIYIAFVNDGSQCGYLGLNDFALSQYYASIENTTSPFLTSEADVHPTFTCKLRTPVPCNGFTAVMKASNGSESTYTNATQLNSQVQNFQVTFPDPIKVNIGDRIDYTISLTPNFEGAKSLTISGELICAVGYPAVVVEEEATGEHCTYCPRGAAALAKFSADYPERYIAIGVHCSNLSTSVMRSIPYANPFLTMMGTKLGLSSLPSACINRKTDAKVSYPASSAQAINEVLNSYTPIYVDIDKVEFDENSKHVDVHFSPEVIVDMNTDKYRAAAVLIADGLTSEFPGYDATNEEVNRYLEWAQVNGYNTYSEAQIAANYGADWIPYYKPFLGTGNPVYNLVYNHVGLGIYPDFEGEGAPCPTEWKGQTPYPMTISFDMPMQTIKNGFGVQDWHKTSIAVLIIDKTTGDIATAAKMKASDYTLVTSGVESVENDYGYKAYRSADCLIVEAERGAQVDIFTIDGLHVYSTIMTENTAEISSNLFHGLMLVKVTDDNKHFSQKILWNK